MEPSLPIGGLVGLRAGMSQDLKTISNPSTTSRELRGKYYQRDQQEPSLVRGAPPPIMQRRAQGSC
jgi:hypothetical protein